MRTRQLRTRRSAPQATVAVVLSLGSVVSAGGIACHGSGGAARRTDQQTAGAIEPTALRDAARTEAGPTGGRWDWNGVIGTGQSLSVGAEARITEQYAQPFGNLKLSLGAAKLGMPPYDPNDPQLSLVPLVEPIRAEVTRYPGAYPLNIFGETPHTAMANEISALFRADTGGDYLTVHTVVGESGQGIHVIDKTATPSANLGHAYAATLFEVAAVKRLAAAAGKTYGVAAVILTHGETDGVNPNYGAEVFRLYQDYDADIRAITGQSRKIPLLLTQQQTSPGNDSPPTSLLAAWRLGVDHPAEIVCVGPKYQYEYAPDRVHLVARSYDQLGEKYAEVYYETVVLGREWRPLQPTSQGVRRAGRKIAVTFHVPVPPLVWEERLPAPHSSAHTAWSRGRGFEVQGPNGEEPIASVTIEGPSVVIALERDPAPANLVVRYAVTQDGQGNFGGLATGRIGQLRDSDPLLGFATKLPQYNYAVSFELPVP
jgi:hypothetical protein